MGFHGNIRENARRLLEESGEDLVLLNNTLRLLAKWRSTLILNTVLHHQGVKVIDGPFAGMEYLDRTAEGCHVAKLLGCYEQPLHGEIEKAIAGGYTAIINIGCAEGYYAVGFARRMEFAEVYAYDLDEKARMTCALLAEKNHVVDRVQVAAGFTVKDFAHFSGHHALVLCDIEGAEKDLLQPAVAPALAGMDLLVESHECFVPGISKMLRDRFAATHHAHIIYDNGQRHLSHLPPWFHSLAHLDQLLAVWEWRSGPTPWLLLKSKSRP